MKPSRVSAGDILHSRDTYNWISHSIAKRHTETDTFKERKRDVSVLALAYVWLRLNIRLWIRRNKGCQKAINAGENFTTL